MVSTDGGDRVMTNRKLSLIYRKAVMGEWRSSVNFMPLLFGSVFGANVLTMSIMNFMEAHTAAAPTIYLIAIVAMALLMIASRIGFPVLNSREHFGCCALALIFFLPRMAYLFEGSIGYSLIPLGDDIYHVANLASIIHTETFPPRSTYDNSEYLAYYYAPWMPGAVLYHAGVASTVKQALAITKLLYCFFISYALVYAGKVLFENRRSRSAFIVVCLLYGGFDFLFWIANLNFVPEHSEWWASEFGFVLQYSNFVTLTMWTSQHFLAAICVLFCLYILRQSDGVAVYALVGVLLLSALFSSPFSVFGAIPLSLWYLIKFRRFSAIPVAALVFGVLSIPLWWIFLGNERVGVQPFGALAAPLLQNHKWLGFGAFVVILGLELGPLIAAAAFSVVRRNSTMRWVFVGSLLYLLSTFFVFYSENYSMRGSIIPIFTLIYLGAPVIGESWRAGNLQWARALFAAYLLGGVLEYASFSRSAIIEFQQSMTAFNAAALRSNTAPGTMASMKLARDAAEYPCGWGVLEKHKPVPKSPLIVDEARQMHPDNCYRVSISRVLGGSCVIP
ncbi:hypothetical protein [Peristeroidobacter agariperforans]|uniref:hypothetical protein n=1 Tax=Peristeroidobacter agariperforans TaxID=268404 RepID=UPI00101CC592|nr:hypothetical protein [Peristeroidobacter agariperforans]